MRLWNIFQTREKKEHFTIPSGIKMLPLAKVYVGNTVKMPLPAEAKEVVSYYCEDETIAEITNGVVTALQYGETKVYAKVMQTEGDDSFEVCYGMEVQVVVGNFKLKTYYSTKFDQQAVPVLKERDSTFVSLGKTAKIIPALSYGVFTGIEYTSDHEEIAVVSKDGLNGMVKAVGIGTAVITATADIAGSQLVKTIEIKVCKASIPIQNPVNAKEYTIDSEWEGSRVYFGRYEQDNNRSNGTEPILWRVLEVTDESVLLLSEYGLESKNINNYFESATWETCSMRKWLNQEFLDRVFTVRERSVLLENEVHTPDNEIWGTKGGNDTKDMVYLLSVEEATNPEYGFYPVFKEASNTRTIKNTEYATAHDGYTSKKNGNTCWWLRSPGSKNQFAYFFTNGSGTYSYLVGRRNDAVRPVIRVKLSDISFAYKKNRASYPYLLVD